MRKLIIIFVTLMLQFGCTILDPKPFLDFSSAVRSASNSANKALGINYEWERENFIYDVAIGDEDIYLIFLDKPLNYKAQFREGVPFFYTLKDVRDVLNQVNQATIKYIDLLIVLVGDKSVTKKEFDRYAKDLNDSMNSVIYQLNADISGEAIPIFSLVATEIVKMVMEGKRKAAIIKVLEGNQPIIEAYSRKCINLVDTVEQSLYHSYAKYFANAEEELFKLENILSRREFVREILNFNEQYIAIVSALGTTRKIYETLPKAHDALYGSITKKSLNIQYILDLYKYGEQLEKTYRELKSE